MGHVGKVSLFVLLERKHLLEYIQSEVELIR
jgi:hypothetical protein